MAQLTVEERLEKLESQVKDLLAAIQPQKPGKYDWLSTVGMFGNDPVMKEICDEALRLREEDRERCRREWETQEQQVS